MKPSKTAGTALVLDGHSNAAVETLQSLGRAGIAVDVAATRECLAFRSRYCRQRLRQPSVSEPEVFSNWLQTAVAANSYRLIVPSTETSLRGLMYLPEADTVRHKAVLPSNNSLEIALNKQLTWESAQLFGVPVPASRLITVRENTAEAKRFPVVLKPATSTVIIEGQCVRLEPVVVTTSEEWVRALDRLLPLYPVLEQEYVVGTGVGIECLYSQGYCIWYFQHERLHELPLTGGGSSYRRSAPIDKSLLAAAKRLLDSLEWHGVAMIEFKGSSAQGFRLIEINPRLWGSLALAIDAGVDFPKGLWDIATNKNPGPQPSYKWPYYSRNLEADMNWLKDNWQTDHSNQLLLTQPRLRSLLEYARPLLGRESWDHFDVKDWRIWNHTLYRTLKAGWHGVKVMLKELSVAYLVWRHRRLLVRLNSQEEKCIQRILFVCYGNICRSPLAEIYARKLMPELEVASAGFHEIEGRTSPARFQPVAAELGIDLSGWRSKRLDRFQVKWAQLIVLADIENLERLKQEFPSAVHKATLLGLFLPIPHPSIQDPYNLDASQARAAARAVLAAVDGLVGWSCQ